MLRAIKAACGGDHAFFVDTVWPWLQGNEGNVDRGIEWVEERWNSFRDSQLGAEFVYRTAFPFGFTEWSDGDAQDVLNRTGFAEAVLFETYAAIRVSSSWA